MHRLGGLDSMFLNLETPAVPMHIGAVIILDAPNAPHLSYETVSAVVANRVHLIPSFRRRVVFPPLNLIRPYWMEDPDFRISHHVLHRLLPAPGTQEQLTELVAEIMEKPLRRDRPLWELHYIDGLHDGRVACVAKVHHACVDGMGGVKLFDQIFDLTSEIPVHEPPLWEPDEMPSLAALNWMTARSVVLAPRMLRNLVKETYDFAKDFFSSEMLDHVAQPAAVSAAALPENCVAEVKESAKEIKMLAPKTRFNSTINASRSFATARLPLSAIQRLKEQYSCSINDVVLAICGGALRQYLQDHGELPEVSLVAAVPMSVRSGEADGAASGGNQVLISRVTLATDIADPVERVQLISRRMGRIKRVGKKLPAKLMMDWVKVPSPALFYQAARFYEVLSLQDMVALPANLVISNVAGPAQTRYFAGARVEELYPVSIPYHGLALNITLLSYAGRLHFGFTAHPDSVPDLEKFPQLLERSLRALQRRARAQSDDQAQIKVAQPSIRAASKDSASVHAQA